MLAAGRTVTVVGHHEEKLALLRTVGATTLLERDVARSLDGTAAVVEATGSPSGLALALRIARPRGTVILKTTVAGPTSVDLSPIVINELRVLGSRCGDMTRAVATLASGRLDPTPLVVATYPLEQAEAALEHAARPGTLKILVRG